MEGEKFILTDASTFNDIKGLEFMQPYMKYLIGKTADDDPGLDTPFGEKTMPEEMHIGYDAKIVVPALNELSKLAGEGELQSINFYTDEEIKADPTLEETGMLYIPARDPNGTFAMLFSGGGFFTVSNESEALPIAMHLRDLGISSFVVQYRTAMPGSLPYAVEDTHNAAKYVLDHLDDFGLTDNYAVYGGSAGGYLALSFGTDNHGYQSAGIKAPSIIMATYPMANIDPENPFMFIMFAEPTPEIISEYNIIDHITDSYPKTYIEASKDDEALSFTDNAQLMYDMLAPLGVDVTLKAVDHGIHGLGIATGYEAEGWLDEAVALWQND